MRSRCLICDFARLAGVNAVCRTRNLVAIVQATRLEADVRVQDLDTTVRVLGQHGGGYPPWTINTQQADAHEYLCWMVQEYLRR